MQAGGQSLTLANVYRLVTFLLVGWQLQAAGLWYQAPPAPELTATERMAELSARRSKVMAQVGPRGMLVLLAAEERPFAADVAYPYRQENNFYYLTGIKQQGAVLLLLPGAASANERELLFLPVKSRTRQIYTGAVIASGEAAAISGISNVRPMSDLMPLLNTVAPTASQALTATALTETELVRNEPRGSGSAEPAKEVVEQWRKQYETFTKALKDWTAEIYLILPLTPGNEEYRREQTIAGALATVSAGFTVRSALPIFRELRVKKSPYEIALVQHAIDISAEGFQRVWATVAPGLHEYDLQAEFDFTYTRRQARFGYPSIVGSGVNGTTLHYEDNNGPLVDGSAVVLDAGAEYDGYSADVTRTFPVNGKFSAAQAEIYQLVYRAQQAAIAAAHPGQSIGTIKQEDAASFSGVSSQVLREGLVKLGLMTKKDDDEQLRLWLPHGVTHQLGMNVHDIAKPGLELAPGMIVTIEPGLYFRPDALDALPKSPENDKLIAAVRPAYEKYKGIGVRIEDDILITEKGARVMSALVPSKLEDVEATMARLKAQRQQQPLP